MKKLHEIFNNAIEEMAAENRMKTAVPGPVAKLNVSINLPNDQSLSVSFVSLISQQTEGDQKFITILTSAQAQTLAAEILKALAEIKDENGISQ